MPTLRLLLIVVLLLIISYGAVEAMPFLSGPVLSISSPVNGASTTNGIIKVTGHTKRIVTLTLNSATLLPDRNGTFSKTLALPHGESIITLKVSDRFGHTVTDTRTIFAK